MIGWQEVLLICFVVLLLFGAKRIPEVARALGKASREFQNAKDGMLDEINKEPAASEKKQEETADKEEEKK